MLQLLILGQDFSSFYLYNLLENMNKDNTVWWKQHDIIISSWCHYTKSQYMMKLTYYSALPTTNNSSSRASANSQWQLFTLNCHCTDWLTMFTEYLGSLSFVYQHCVCYSVIRKDAGICLYPTPSSFNGVMRSQVRMRIIVMITKVYAP